MNSERSEFSRRTVLKKAAAGSVALGAAGLGSSSAAGQSLPGDTDVSIEEYVVLDQYELSQYRDIVQAHPATELFEEKFAEYGLEAISATGFEVVTDDPEVNAASPAIVVLGYAEETGDGRRRTHRTRSHGASGNSGAIVAHLEEHGGRMRVVSAMPYVAEETTGTADTGGREYTIKALVSPQTGTGTISAQSSTLDDLRVEERVQDTVNLDDSEFTEDAVRAQDAEDDLISALCGGLCTPMVAWICDRASDGVSKSICVRACWRFITSPYLLGACGAVCLLLVDFINDRGCAAGAATLCGAWCSQV